jgi:hypothetical protein
MLLGDWSIGTLFVWETGARFGVSSGLQTLFGNVASLADFSGDRNIGGRSPGRGGLSWFNASDVASFTFPAAGETGNSGRNSFKGPRYVNLDLSFFKSFPLREQKRIQFRIEVYNAFNKAHFGLPITNLSSPDFGKFTYTVGTPRTVRAALRFDF